MLGLGLRQESCPNQEKQPGIHLGITTQPMCKLHAVNVWLPCECENVKIKLWKIINEKIYGKKRYVKNKWSVWPPCGLLNWVLNWDRPSGDAYLVRIECGVALQCNQAVYTPNEGSQWRKGRRREWILRPAYMPDVGSCPPNLWLLDLCLLDQNMLPPWQGAIC